MSRGVRFDFCGIIGNTGEPDADGIRWSFDPTDGWDSADQDIEVSTSTGRVGGDLLSDDLGPRRINLEGAANCPTRAAADLAYRLAKGSMPPRGEVRDLVEHADLVRTAHVRRGDRPRVTRVGPLYVTFQLALVALDPFLHGAAHTVDLSAGATTGLVNAGDEPARLSVETLTSGTVRLKHLVTGQVMATRGVVPAHTHFDDYTITSDAGVELYGLMASPSEWLWIARDGTTNVKQEGTAQLRITHHDAYA